MAGSFIGQSVDVTVTNLLRYLFYPFTVAMGVPLEDAPQIARILGERLIMTEVHSYQSLAILIKEGAILYERSAVIAIYALCGFAHIPSLAIFVGGTSSLVPERAKDITAIGLWALFVANIACFITGSIAGAFYSPNSGILLAP